MARQHDFGELLADVSELLNFNVTQTDQDYTTAQLQRAINRAYVREVNRAKQHGVRDWFKATQDIAWAAEAVTLALPADVVSDELLAIYDVTDNDPGVLLAVGDEFSATVFWKDASTLQWGEVGPSEAKTLRCVFFAVPAEMELDSDEPVLIPVQYREVLVWSAACWLRKIADEMSPPAWETELQELRFDFWKGISRGRPVSNAPKYGWSEDVAVDSPAAPQDGSSIGG